MLMSLAEARPLAAAVVDDVGPALLFFELPHAARKALLRMATPPRRRNRVRCRPPSTKSARCSSVMRSSSNIRSSASRSTGMARSCSSCEARTWRRISSFGKSTLSPGVTGSGRVLEGVDGTVDREEARNEVSERAAGRHAEGGAVLRFHRQDRRRQLLCLHLLEDPERQQVGGGRRVLEEAAELEHSGSVTGGRELT